jgi:hypothetical protein
MRPGHAAEDLCQVHQQVERGAPFCANPACVLHVGRADGRVEGGGDWATLADGRVFGRGRYGGLLLCDACGTRRGPVRLRAGAC